MRPSDLKKHLYTHIKTIEQSYTLYKGIINRAEERAFSRKTAVLQNVVGIYKAMRSQHTALASHVFVLVWLGHYTPEPVVCL